MPGANVTETKAIKAFHFDLIWILDCSECVLLPKGKRGDRSTIIKFNYMQMELWNIRSKEWRLK